MSLLFYKTRKVLLTPVQKSQIVCKPWEYHDKKQQYGHALENLLFTTCQWMICHFEQLAKFRFPSLVL